MTPRLITISWSHFCDKARWALERSNVAYDERAHLAIFHYVAVLWSRRGISVPTLETDDGVLPDSTDILQWVARQPGGAWLYPAAHRDEIAALEDLFDESLGPATRRLAYLDALRDPSLARTMDTSTLPRFEATLFPFVFPVAATYLRWRLGVTEAAAHADRERIRTIFDEVQRRLGDRPFLVGDRFSAADLTFAALAAPIVLPPEARYLPQRPHVSAAYGDVVDAFRAHPAGLFALRLYREERLGGRRGDVSPAPSRP